MTAESDRKREPHQKQGRVEEGEGHEGGESLTKENEREDVDDSRSEGGRECQVEVVDSLSKRRQTRRLSYRLETEAKDQRRENHSRNRASLCKLCPYLEGRRSSWRLGRRWRGSRASRQGRRRIVSSSRGGGGSPSRRGFLVGLMYGED